MSIRPYIILGDYAKLGKASYKNRLSDKAAYFVRIKRVLLF